MTEHATPTRLPNEAVVEAIRKHHDELAAQLGERTAALVTAARAGAPDAAREQLHRWYEAELLPHAVAEEGTLYAAGTELDATRLLVRGMLAEHRALIGLIGQLAVPLDPFAAVAAATSAHDLFTVHLAKENDLLLPALDRAGVKLAPLLEGMHELLGHHERHHDEPETTGDGAAGV